MNIGAVYFELENEEKAIEFLKIALGIAIEVNAVNVLGDLYNNIGLAYNTSDKNQSLNYLKKALEIYKSSNQTIEIASTLNNIGRILADQKKFLEADRYYKESLKMSEGLNNKIGMAKILYNMGLMYSQTNNNYESIISLRKAFDYAKETNDKSDLAEICLLLSKDYEKDNDHKNALNLYKFYVATKDSILNEQTVNTINKLQTQYETKEKEKEITLLQKDNELQQATIGKQNQFRNFLIIGFLLFSIVSYLLYNRFRLKQKYATEKNKLVLEQKVLRSQMNPHFIFNSLNSIANFITENNPVVAVQYLTKFSKLMRMILEYSQEEKITVEKEAELLQYYLSLEQLRFKNKFNFTINVDPSIEDDVTIPPMLLQPQVENAILHGIAPKDGNGNINISFKMKDDDTLICQVEDDGVGRKREIPNELKQHKSFAMKITQKRLADLGKNRSLDKKMEVIDLRDESGNALGTKVIINVPLSFN